jgi:hypothetical protein
VTTRITGALFAFLLSTVAAPLWAGNYTAASCNYSDVNAVINGPTHVAVAGDVITIPSGTCTWTSGLSIPVGITLTGAGTPNTTPTTFGSGTLSTVIIDNVSGNTMISVPLITTGQMFRLSTLDIEPASASTSLVSPVELAGVCNSSGCPNVRVDNIGFGLTTQWNEAGNGSAADWMIRTDNVVGVIDHCTLPSGSAVELANLNLSAYLGVGAFGDNSWAQPDSFGGANNLFMENNNVTTNQAMTDCDTAPVGGATGGCRIVGRFNHFNLNAGFSMLYVHGLDTGQRMRSGRQQEAYGNTITCVSSNGCNAGTATFRGSTGFSFGNTMNATNGGFYNSIATILVYRIVFNATPWGYCGGLGLSDTNDGVVYYTGTVTNASGLTMTDTSKSWTTNQLTPIGAPYSVYNVTQGFFSEVSSNTSNTITVQGPISESGWSGFNNGDVYQILRSTVCADQAGRGAGALVSGSTPTVAAISQALDPIYEWDNTAAPLYHGNLGANTGRVIANRDWYTDNSNGSPKAQTSPTSPFNGTSGVGFGALSNRPTTCTAGVGYFATDQGSWNTSGNSFGQGELFTCSATNTWSLHYTPYTYPHPLTQGQGNTETGSTGTGSTTATPPTPPTSLQATVK